MPKLLATKISKKNKRSTPPKKGPKKPKRSETPEYTKCARLSVKDTMGRFKRDELRYARSKKNPTGRPVTSRKQALAIALSIPPKKCTVKVTPKIERRFELGSCPFCS